MPQPYRSSVIAAPVERVWAAVRDFGGLSTWHPAIAESALDSGVDGEVGAVRRLALAGGGGTVVERLITLDDRFRVLTYTFVESPFAAREYVSTIHLYPVTDSDATFAEWFATFDCDTADEEQLVGLFGDAVYAAGLTALAEHVSAAATP